MAEEWEKAMERWLKANLIDAATAARIRAFESGEKQSQGLRWPVILALALGGLMLGAGVLLFVAAHWDKLSPTQRFTLVLFMVSAFHVAGALTVERFENLAVTLHALGTVALGAGIFLSGQIFNLQEHWPGGLMLWALGAWIGWGMRRDWVQATLVALLTPAWLIGEWIVVTERLRGGYRILLVGTLLLSFSYLTARTAARDSLVRRALMWIGGLALIPSTVMLAELAWERPWQVSNLPLPMTILGWTAALGLPLLVALLARGSAAGLNLLAALWVLVLGLLGQWAAEREGIRLLVYLWCALGSCGLVAWGVTESRRERINLGVAGFALTVLFFYFSSVMDKLGRAVSLIGLGALFLLGGWVLEKLRRQLVAMVRGRQV
ncbi:MAG: DUF2157 domain-containing protein [Acidobacteria bacterium]|nr:DUF2157 domain-containing protein [Acidobacteriota bacterium]MBI3658582.1 DUF2157 domain-containing protein [Acidobacteriota bacterium]